MKEGEFFSKNNGNCWRKSKIILQIPLVFIRISLSFCYTVLCAGIARRKYMKKLIKSRGSFVTTKFDSVPH